MFEEMKKKEREKERGRESERERKRRCGNVGRVHYLSELRGVLCTAHFEFSANG